MKNHLKKIVALGAVVAGLAAMGGYAFAATGTSTANVTVNNTLSVSGLTSSFSLTGNPGDTQSSAVSFTVTTNNPTGYTASVEAAAANLTGARSGNTDVIPVSGFMINEDGGSYGATGAITNTSATTLVTTATETTSGGDTHATGYKMQIPFVEADTYSGTLNYTFTANP